MVRIRAGRAAGSMNMAFVTSCWAERSSRKPSKADRPQLEHGLEELDLALRAEHALPALADGQARQLRPDALEHQPRRVLQQRRQDAGGGQHDHGRQQQARRIHGRWPGTGRWHRRCSRATSRRDCRAAACSDRLRWATPPTRKKLAMTRMPSSEASVAASRENGTIAPLEGVADLLLGRLLGLAFLVGCLGHARAARQAVMSLRSSAGRSSISPLAIILSTVSTMAAARLGDVARAAPRRRPAAPPPPCAASARRARRGWRPGTSASVPFRASTSRSIGTWSNTAVRACGGRLARSSKREEHALERLGLVGPHLGKALQDVLRLRLVQPVQDVGDAACARPSAADASSSFAEPRLDHAHAPRRRTRLDAEHPAQQAGAYLGGETS